MGKGCEDFPKKQTNNKRVKRKGKTLTLELVNVLATGHQCGMVLSIRRGLLTMKNLNRDKQTNKQTKRIEKNRGKVELPIDHPFGGIGALSPTNIFQLAIAHFLLLGRAKNWLQSRHAIIQLHPLPPAAAAPLPAPFPPGQWCYQSQLKYRNPKAIFLCEFQN